MSSLEELQVALGRLIKIDRELSHKTIFDVALEAKINIRMLRDIENGESDFKLSLFYRIYKAIGKNPTIKVSQSIIEKAMFQSRIEV